MNPIVSDGNKMKWKMDLNKLTYFGMWSDKFTFQGIDWKIKGRAITQNSIKYLSVHLFHFGDNNSKTNWICETKRLVKVLNQNENGKDITKEGVPIYDGPRTGWECVEFFEWSKLESDGYIKDNSMIVEIELDFKYYDFSKNIPNYTDIILNVEGTKFHVNKALLCSKSEYFFNKFIVDKSDEKELTIENVKAEDFLYFIASFCSFFERVKEKNYEQLIKLAAQYKTPVLHRNCEKFLILHKTLEVEKKIVYADKYDYDELLDTCIDSLTTIDQIEKLHEWKEFKNMKNTTKLAIGKKMIDILKKLEKNEGEFECQSCNNMESEKKLNICQTCNEQDFESEEDVIKFALCSTCAIRKHIREGHVIVDFLPKYLDYKFENQSKAVQVMLANFQQIENIRKDEEHKWKMMNDTADMTFNELIDLTRRSKSTKCAQENMDDVKGFIKKAKDVNENLIKLMKKEELLMQKSLQEMQKWIEEKSKECLEYEEFVQLEI